VIVTPQSSIFEKVNMLTQKLSLSTMFLLVGLLCTFFLSLHSWLVRPVKNMIKALRTQTEKKDESVVLDESVPNELGEIAVLYNKRTQDLVKAKNDAQEANETKSMFLSNMSHELRTPMHAILNYCSLGLKKISPQDDPKTHKYLTNIETSGKRLLSLLNDLLDLSKLEFGKMDFDLTKNNDFTLLINNAVQEVENIAASRHITIRVVNDNEKTVFPFDYTRILQVVINLLSNAIKFSPLSGIITIHFHKTSIYENEFVCSISDEGVGIPLGEENAIFNAFIQSSKTKTGAGGTGLGLSICQHILQAHKGRIWAQNNSEKGASFYIALPYEQSLPEQ
jgi:signal transduction histidine kinase